MRTASCGLWTAGDPRPVTSSAAVRGLVVALLGVLAGCGGRAREDIATAPVPGQPTPGATAVVPAPVPPVPPALVDAPALDYLRVRRLLVPVAGVEPDRIPDTFDAPRGTRRHGAIDILAPRGTPVLSADDGRVLRLSSNAAGGITVYATNPDGRLVYYYAHLERYQPGLVEGMRLARGDTLGYVGTTGNAPPDTPHLHFQLMLVVPARKYWDGVPIDPIPYLVPNRAQHLHGTR